MSLTNSAQPQTNASDVVTFEPMRVETPVDLAPPLLANTTDSLVPPFAQKLEDLNVNRGFMLDLVLKVVSQDVDCTTSSVAEKLRLGIVITETLLQELYREKLIEMKGVVGLQNHRYTMLENGWTRVNRAMNMCSYIGPAPVSLKSYTDMIVNQVRTRPPLTQHALDVAMKGLVLSEGAKQTLGLVASTGRSLFLSGPPGNGKTMMARALVDAIISDVWIPYAIEVDGQVIRVFDLHNHQPVEVTSDDYDRRWIKIRPPLVVVGGELTIESMELSCTDTQRFYEAPFQLKSNGGVLVVDDLGRQRCSATDLLNRWIIPLENRIDYLTLSTGKKIQVPFEQVVVFATNLMVSDLVDEAFMRRMGYRLCVMAPSPDTYAEIFIRYARARGLSVDRSIFAHLEKRYGFEKREPKACEPRDLIDRAIEACKFKREPIRLTKETLDMAWGTYFGASVNG